jgi:predicted transcriptional regulator
MNLPLVRAFALTIFLLLAVAPSSAIVTSGGYSAAPAAAGVLSLPPQDPVPISFWELTPRMIIIALCFSFFPLFVYPVEIFFFIRLFTALGYRRVTQYALSYNRNREVIYETIVAHPGLKFNALEHLTGMKEGTLKYHLLRLERKRKIVTVRFVTSLRYFENDGRYTELEKKVFLHGQNPTTRMILEIISDSPGVSRKDIAAILGIAGPSVSWHTNRLWCDGIITTRKNGKGVRYRFCPGGKEIFRRFLVEDAAHWESPATGTEPEKKPESDRCISDGS